MYKVWGGASFTKSESFTKSKIANESESVTQSDKDTNLVDPREIIEKIKRVNQRYEDSKKRSSGLLNDVRSAQNAIKAVLDGHEGRSWGSLDKEALLLLINKVNNGSYNSISSIGQLIDSNNENSKLLAEMISALTMLSGLSFEKISETTAELEEIASQIQEGSSGNKVQGIQIKRIIVAQIEKIKEEKKRAERIQSNFGVIDESIRKIVEDFNFKHNEIQNKIEHLENEIFKTLETHDNKIEGIGNGVDKTLKKQKYQINFLSIISLINLLVILGFVFYFFITR